MKRIVATSLCFAACWVSSNASAAERSFQLSLRTGYALPFGYSNGTGTSGNVRSYETKMSDAFSGGVPIWIDAGYMVTQGLLLGVYFEYGFVGVKSSKASNPRVGCPTGASCSAHDIHYGVQAQYHFGFGQAIDPWLGFGIGRESLSLSQSLNGVTNDGALSGWEFARLQAGADFGVAEGVGVGPFVSFSFGQYSSMHAESGGLGVDADIPSTRMHEWLTFGAKGSFAF